MRVAICDDNRHDTELICFLIREHFDKKGFAGELHTFTSGEALLEAFTAEPFDAVFLDIYMGGINGVETAEKLRAISPAFALVFITTSEDHAMDAFSLGSNSYVVKPIKRKSIDMAFEKCRDIFVSNGRYIDVHCDRMKFQVPLIKILYIETFGRETLYHTIDRHFRSTARVSLDAIKRMAGQSFLRCHRSYLVNLNHVEAIQPDSFLMRDGSLIPLRQRGRTELRDEYADFVSDRLFGVSS